MYQGQFPIIEDGPHTSHHPCSRGFSSISRRSNYVVLWQNAVTGSGGFVEVVILTAVGSYVGTMINKGVLTILEQASELLSEIGAAPPCQTSGGGERRRI